MVCFSWLRDDRARRVQRSKAAGDSMGDRSAGKTRTPTEQNVRE
jgi:hypothetical protein